LSVTTSLVRNAMQITMMRKAYSAEQVMNRLDLSQGFLEYILYTTYGAGNVMNKLYLSQGFLKYILYTRYGA
jgi:hypothetical protein